MRITTWAEYGLIVSIHLARQGRAQPIPARALADSQGLPPDYVEQILLKLRRAGIVTSVRGAKGGYRLARHPSGVSVKDVIEAAEDRTFELNCDAYQVDADRCSPESACSIRPVWRELQRRIDDLLQRISLADLLRGEKEVGELVTLTSAEK